MLRPRAILPLAALASACLGVPDVATESNDGSAVSADGRRMRLIHRNRGWQEGRQGYQLYSKVPYVSSSSVTIMGLRLAMPTRWADNTQISLYTFDTRWWADADMGLAIYHRAEGTFGNWIPIRCTTTNGVAPAANEIQYFHASQALIDLQAGELELVPVAVNGAGTGTGTRDQFERDSGYGDEYDDRYDSTGRDRNQQRATTISTFAQCGITEPNPEFSAYVFPYSVGFWSDKFDYDFGALCDGDPCPAYRGDPNEPRRQNNGLPGGGGQLPGGGGNNVIPVDPNRNTWEITDDMTWQCGRATAVGAGNVAMARAEIRGSHARPAQLEATLKKVGGSTNVNLFSSNGIASFPITRSVATSNELFAGTWELCVRDTVRGDVGRIDGWNIVLEQAPGNNGNNNNGGAQPGVVAVTANTTRQDSIENNVQDWFSISLTQGQTLTLTTSGSCAQEQAAPVISIHSSLPVNRPTWSECPTQGSADWTNSTTQACADDGGDSGYCTTTNARAAVTGTYYVRVIGYDNEYPGTYSITFNVR